MRVYGLRKRKFDYGKLFKIALIIILSIGAIKIGQLPETCSTSLIKRLLERLKLKL